MKKINNPGKPHSHKIIAMQQAKHCNLIPQNAHSTLSTQACNHMNAKKGIQLVLILAIHRHTNESVGMNEEYLSDNPSYP